jgi:hypothetical protein
MRLEERDFNTARREELADSGKAMADGSFPIVNREDLGNAIKLVGRSKNPAAAKRHIIKRARALGATDMLPDDWGVSEALDGAVLLSESMTGSVVDVLLIKAGVSANRRQYRPEVLREALPLFEGARAFAANGPDHNSAERGVKSLVGWYTDPRYVTDVSLPGGKKTVEGIAANFHISEAAPWLRSLIADAIRRGKPDLVGFSIVGDGQVQVMREARSNRPIHDVSRIDSIDSVDVVVSPAAGGVPLRLVASKEVPSVGTPSVAEAVKGLASGTILPDELKEEQPELHESLVDGTALTSEDEPPEKPEEPAEPGPEDLDARVAEAIGVRMTPVLVEAKLAGTKLPEKSKDRVRSTAQGKALSESEIEKLVKDEADYVASFNPALVTDAGPATSDMKGEQDQITEAIDKILQGESNDSFREIYVSLTGDAGMTGRYQPGGRLTESVISSTFDQIMADSITRQMVRQYTMAALDQQWRPLVDIVPKRDFRTERRTRMGGYGNLPTVAEGGPYTALTTPGDEEATYAISKKGGTEDLTLEAVANDDLGALRAIPTKLGRAAARTLHKFVFDFLATNGNIYDAVALFHASHGGNLGSTALGAASLSAARLVMKNQTEAGSAEKIGLVPRYLIVPNDLEQTAYELTQTDREVGSANNTLNFARTFGLSVIPVAYFTDNNNWFLVADKGDVPTIEIAFFNGREEPELFLQDSPTVGSVFSNDKLTWKIRHIYGGAVIDYRGFFGAVVA